jgi:hypothetical protein
MLLSRAVLIALIGCWFASCKESAQEVALLQAIPELKNAWRASPGSPQLALNFAYHAHQLQNLQYARFPDNVSAARPPLPRSHLRCAFTHRTVTRNRPPSWQALLLEAMEAYEVFVAHPDSAAAPSLPDVLQLLGTAAHALGRFSRAQEVGREPPRRHALVTTHSIAVDVDGRTRAAPRLPYFRLPPSTRVTLCFVMHAL